MQLCVRVLYILMVLSPPQEAINEPSGDTAAHQTLSSCPASDTTCETFCMWRRDPQTSACRRRKKAASQQALIFKHARHTRGGRR